MEPRIKSLLVLILSLAILLPIGRVFPSSSQKTDDLIIYSGRSEELVGAIIDRFIKESGIEVRVRYAGTSELAVTIMEEGKRSPADLFWAQDPSGLGAVSELLSQIPPEILERVEERFRSPRGIWVGISGRARVVAYNTSRLTENDLPEDMWGFTNPRWKGRIGWAPTNGSFQAMVTAMRVLWGEEDARKWVEAIHANNPKVYPNNTSILNAVGSGEVDVGFSNHYYLMRFIIERGEGFPVRNYHPRSGGPGSVILVSGAGVLESSSNKEKAWRFLNYVLSDEVQSYFAEQTFEYPVIKGIETSPLLLPVSGIKSPWIDMSEMEDLRGTLDLLRKTGVLP